MKIFSLSRIQKMFISFQLHYYYDGNHVRYSALLIHNNLPLNDAGLKHSFSLVYKNKYNTSVNRVKISLNYNGIYQKKSVAAVGVVSQTLLTNMLIPTYFSIVF